MGVTTVRQVLANVRTTLQDIADAAQVRRWSDAELIHWLNEAYQATVALKPGVGAVTDVLELTKGVRQQIPDGGIRLVDVVRNTASSSDGYPVTPVNRAEMDAVDPGWYRLPEELNIEHYMVDDQNPKSFYVYPPAAAGAEVEIIYVSVPAPHTAEPAALDDAVPVDDAYVPALTDYILYRGFDKDSDYAGNMARSGKHFQAFSALLGQRIKIEASTSPNAPKPVAQ